MDSLEGNLRALVLRVGSRGCILPLSGALGSLLSLNFIVLSPLINIEPKIAEKLGS
jgi:hypothetical protein